MSTNEATEGCGPQPFEEQLSHGTPLTRLTELAGEVHSALVAFEKSATPHYWRLGQILMLARKQVPRGEWADFLATVGIEKTRASKARAIFRTFYTAEETAGLSVGEAYERRERRPSARKFLSHTPEEAACGRRAPVATLPHWVDHLAEDAERLRDEVKFLSPEQSEKLGVAIRRVTALLAELAAAVRSNRSNYPGADPNYGVADDNDFRVPRLAEGSNREPLGRRLEAAEIDCFDYFAGAYSGDPLRDAFGPFRDTMSATDEKLRPLLGPEDSA